MTSTPSPGSHPHTDPDAELPETVAVHIEWLRRPRSVSNDVDAYRADNRQSADYLSRLLAVAHRLAERAETAETEAADARLDAEGWEHTAKAAEAERDETLVPAVVRLTDENHALVADRDRLAARVETLEGAARALPASYPHAAYYLWRQTGDSRAADRCQAFDDAYAALRALVAPDTPTSPTPECTGLTATWCPVHGDCTCEALPGVRDTGPGDDPACPLHAPESLHDPHDGHTISLGPSTSPPPSTQRRVEVADDDLTDLHPSPAVVRLTAERDALRSVVRHYAEVVEKERPHFPPFREWEDEDWADSGWTPAESAAIRAALVAPDTPTSHEEDGEPAWPYETTPTSPTDTGDDQ